MTVRDSHAVELRVRDAIMAARRDMREVKLHVHGFDGVPVPADAASKNDDPAAVPLIDPAAASQQQANGINSDFTRHNC